MIRRPARTIALAFGLLATTPALAAPPPWDGFQLLMWQDHPPAALAGLRAMGFTGIKVRGTGGTVDTALRTAAIQAGLGFYLENIATDFYAPYHRYTPGKSVTWLFDAAKARLAARDPAAFHREPSLSDPAALATVQHRLATIVAENRPFAPLFYNLGDESGIADLAAAWDADTSPASLDGFRAWLQTRYPDIDALNRQWGTAYASWDAVQPELTDAALARTDDNFSAWSDFKAWMDVSFARAVRAGTDAVHAADPAARAALEGGQLPGWGGYDYARLAPALDVMEIYDFGQSLDLATAANPALIPFHTAFGRGAPETHATWRFVLHGGRGQVVWDENGDIVTPQGAPGPRGTELAALLATIRPLFTGAASLADATPDPDPVAILVDQESFRLTWLLDRRAGNRDWAARDAEREYDDNAWRASRRLMAGALAELGVQPRFVSADTLDSGRLPPGLRLLLLPHAIALSDRALDTIRTFRAGGGTVLADTEPGLFDGHGRRRATPPLPDLPHPQALRVTGDPADLPGIATLLHAAGAPPRLRLRFPDDGTVPGVEARWFRAADGSTVLGLQSARPWSAPPGFLLQLSTPATVTDLRRPGPAATGTSFPVVLDPVEPTILRLAHP